MWLKLVIGFPLFTCIIRIILFLTIYNFDTPNYYMNKQKEGKVRQVLESIYYSVYVEEIMEDYKYETKQTNF